jgi:hypothetical protein
MRNVFLRDRAAFLVGVGKRGSRMGDTGKPTAAACQTRLNHMDATANFSLRFARAPDSKAETTDWLLSRQVLQRIATRISLVSEAIGLSIVGILIIMNRHEAGVNGLGGSAVALIGAISAILVATVFLVAACLHWRFCARHSAELLGTRQPARFTFSRPDPVMAFGLPSSSASAPAEKKENGEARKEASELELRH